MSHIWRVRRITRPASEGHSDQRDTLITRTLGWRAPLPQPDSQPSSVYMRTDLVWPNRAAHASSLHVRMCVRENESIAH